MLQLEPISVLRRSATFELRTDARTCYYSDAAYTIVLNGEVWGTSDKNVFTLSRLQPSMCYDVQVNIGGETAGCSFLTPPETMLLNVTDFGAVGDGKADCTGAIQAALAACPSGGTVLIPAGVYLSYPLFLPGGVLLYLDKDAVLMGGADKSLYPVLPGMVTDDAGLSETSFGTWEGNPLDCHASLLTCIGGRDVAVAGEGTVDGNAFPAGWWENVKTRGRAWRPRTVFCVRCDGFTVMGISIRNSPSWTVHPYYCRNMDVLDVRILNPSDSPNTDGCNPESSENVRIIGAHISVGDDCVAIKSGKYYMGLYHTAPSRDILVRNCLLERGHGAVVLGSEISAGAYGLLVEQCVMRNTDRGLRIKNRRGRGDMSVISGVELADIRMENVQSPFVVDMFYFCDPDGHSDYVQDKNPRPADGLTPSVESIFCHDIVCTGCEFAGIYIYGLPEKPVVSARFRRVSLEFAENAREGLPAMMDGAEPVKKLAQFAANVNELLLEDVTFTGEEGEQHRLHNVSRFVCTAENRHEHTRKEKQDGSLGNNDPYAGIHGLPAGAFNG